MGSALAPKCQLCPSRDGLGPAPRKACEKLLTPRVTRDFAQQAARGRGGAGPECGRTDGRGYLKQPEGGQPAGAALLVLRTQQPQPLCLVCDFVWLEVKEAPVSVAPRIRNTLGVPAGLGPTRAGRQPTSGQASRCPRTLSSASSFLDLLLGCALGRPPLGGSVDTGRKAKPGRTKWWA